VERYPRRLRRSRGTLRIHRLPPHLTFARGSILLWNTADVSSSETTSRWHTKAASLRPSPDASPHPFGVKPRGGRVDTTRVLPPLVKRTAALLFVTLFAVVAATAHAADPAPKTFKGHGLSFKYPGSWSEVPATFVAQIGHALWTESIGPEPQPTSPDPSQPQQTPAPQPEASHRSMVTLAAYHLSVAISPKNIARYKQAITAATAQLAAQLHGRLESGPVRVNVAHMPGYRFELVATLSDGTPIRSRVVYIFKKQTEYFLNCQHPQDDPLSADIETGCSLVMRSFRLAK